MRTITDSPLIPFAANNKLNKIISLELATASSRETERINLSIRPI